ncbi:ankyrin repeat domain-containing protein [Candidatus Latescibacterota bacterium]
MNSAALLSRIDTFGYELFCAFSSVVWQSSILIIAAFIASLLLRHRSSTIKHAIWVSVLIIIPLLPTVTWMISQAGSPVAEIKVLPDRAYFMEHIDRAEPVSQTVNAMEAQPEIISVPPVQTQTPETGRIARPSISVRDNIWTGLLSVYLLFVGVFISLTIAVGMRIHSWRRQSSPVNDNRVPGTLSRIQAHFGISGKIAVLESVNISVPVTFGLLRPVVLLPVGFTDELTDDDLTVLLAHELCHIKRHDSLTLMLLTLIRSVFFFHPLVWFASREASYYAECACDTAAFGYTGTPHSYAKMLSRVALRVSRRSIINNYAVGIIPTKKILLRRMYDILENSSRLKQLSRYAKASIFAGIIMSISIAASFPIRGKDGNTSPLFKEFELLSVTQDTTAIRDFLRNNPQLKRMLDLDGQSLCNYIISDTQATALRILLEEGLPFDIPDNRGMTPFRKALKLTNTECLRLLLEHGADPNQKDADGLRPLEYVLEGGVKFTRYGLRDMLIEHGAEVTIHNASLLGDIDRVREIIENDRSAVNEKNREGKTALHVLCNRPKGPIINPEMDKSRVEHLEMSLGKGYLADLNNNCFDITKLLIEHNADLKIRDDYGWMPLHYAAKQGRHEETALLLDEGASVNVKAKDGDTPLHIAVWNNREDTVRKLIEYGADINAVNSYGTTPLAWANFQKYSSIIDILNDNDAEDGTKNTNLKTAWKQFRKSPYSEKALGSLLLASDNYDIAEIARATPPRGWFIRKALRIKRKGGEDFSCIEISLTSQGEGMPKKHPNSFGGGCIYIFDSNGNILHASNDRLFLPENLLFPNALDRNYNLKFITLYNNEKWMDAPDLNGDGYSDIPRLDLTSDSNNFKIYSSHSTDFPLIFESDIPMKSLIDIWELVTNPNYKITENINVSDEIILQYIDKPSPSLRIAALEKRNIFNGSNSYYYVSDESAVPRELARYEWDSTKNAYTGPQAGPDGLWEIKYPDMADNMQ